MSICSFQCGRSTFFYYYTPSCLIVQFVVLVECRPPLLTFVLIVFSAVKELVCIFSFFHGSWQIVILGVCQFVMFDYVEHVDSQLSFLQNKNCDMTNESLKTGEFIRSDVHEVLYDVLGGMGRLFYICGVAKTSYKHVDEVPDFYRNVRNLHFSAWAETITEQKNQSSHAIEMFSSGLAQRFAADSPRKRCLVRST